MQKLLEHIQKEWSVLKQAPGAFVILIVASIAGGVAIGHWHYSERLETKDGEIHRYRVALGIDKASAGALVELTDKELAIRTQATVEQLRGLAATLDNRLTVIKKQKDEKKITDKEVFEQSQEIMKQVSDSYDQNLASDAENLRQELRKRLSSDALAHVVRVPALRAENGASVTLISLFRASGMSGMMIKGLADELEQMAKLLSSQ